MMLVVLMLSQVTGKMVLAVAKVCQAAATSSNTGEKVDCKYDDDDEEEDDNDVDDDDDDEPYDGDDDDVVVAGAFEMERGRGA